MKPRAKRALAPVLGLLLLAAAGGCGEDVGELELATPDRAVFQSDVYPLLLRDCAFHACHGSKNRFLQVFGPGRGRLLDTSRPLDPMDDFEIDHSYERARSMIDPRDPSASLLLRKPLAVAAGGAGHEGTDEHGRDVYDSKLDMRYAVLVDWANMLGEPQPATAGTPVDSTPAAAGPEPGPGAP